MCWQKSIEKSFSKKHEEIKGKIPPEGGTVNSVWEIFLLQVGNFMRNDFDHPAIFQCWIQHSVSIKLIKISVTLGYIKHEVKKNNNTYDFG